ncbi:MAG TPA: glycosyltransferase [Gammaproteobacteria bacterium]|nr:glycosyltransferase [Gammaproteobacteria bacterium]
MSAKPKIVFFHPYFSDGGVERTNIGLARGLIGRGYEVTFVTIRPTEHYLAEVQSLGVEWVVLPANSTLTAQPHFVRWILKEKSLNAPKHAGLVVISCQYYVNLACLMFRVFWGGGVRHMLSERNHPDEFLNRKGFKARAIRWLVRMLYSFADTVIANSRELADDLTVLTGRKVDVVYNPTLNERLYRLADEEVTENWFCSITSKTVLAVGRLSEQKDFVTLIRAFSIVRKVHDAKLLILGEGSERGVLEALIVREELEKDVALPGFVENPYKFMKNADVFVLSSVYEGLPNVLIEALALKVPVVSTACRSGPTEILQGGSLGALVPVEDPVALAEAISSALQECKLDSITHDRIEKGLRRFTPENAVADLLATLEEMGTE